MSDSPKTGRVHITTTSFRDPSEALGKGTFDLRIKAGAVDLTCILTADDATTLAANLLNSLRGYRGMKTTLELVGEMRPFYMQAKRVPVDALLEVGQANVRADGEVWVGVDPWQEHKEST